MELSILIRQTQYRALFDDPRGQFVAKDAIVYNGASPATLMPVKGFVPKGNYVDISKDVANLDKLQLTWTNERDSAGIAQPGAFKAKRSASNTIQIEGDAYKYIKEWLIQDVAAPLNSIDVKIIDSISGTYEGFVIKPTQITWCEDGICEFSLTLQQIDDAYQCVQQTIISDNHQGWFPANGKPVGKKHPRFSYCNEIKPNGLLIGLWWFVGTIAMTTTLMMIPLVIAINPLIWTINKVIGIVNEIRKLFGASIDKVDWNSIPYITTDTFLAPFNNILVESSGCGRVHPAPLIRDYIDNVCKKCGVYVDEVTSPITHSMKLSIETSNDNHNRTGTRQRDNPYYWATYMNAPSKRGIRIFKGLFFTSKQDTEQYWIEANRAAIPLDEFLDQAKTLFNAEWRITNVNGIPTLYFQRKDWFYSGKPLYDYKGNESDRNKIIQGICFSWMDKPQYAYMRGLYTQDPSDSCGNEAIANMNDIIKLGDETNNRNYSGFLDKTTSFFGATKFRLDGASSDYLLDAAQVVLNGQILTPSLFSIVKNVLKKLAPYSEYSLLMKDDTCALPKVIIWDPASGYDFAKAWRDKSAGINGQNLSVFAEPEPNPAYNHNGTPWSTLHSPDTAVKGSSLSFGSNPVGQYVVQEYFGKDAYSAAAELPNYAMYFQPNFKDNLYDWFHWIDDPRINPKINMQWQLKMDLCKGDLDLLRVMGDGSAAAIGDKVRVTNPYYTEGVITEITVSYDSEDENGKYIELKGFV